MKHIFACFLIIISILSGCESKIVFEGKKDFPERYWVFNNPAIFQFEIDEAERPYDLSVNIRNAATYKFQNIYLQYYLEDSTGRLLSKDLKNVQLFNPVKGIPIGTGLGNIYDLDRTFLEGFRFPGPGLYTFRVDQFMRQDSLADVLSVGLRVALADDTNP